MPRNNGQQQPERERKIHRLCQQANMPELADQFICRGMTTIEVFDKLFDLLCSITQRRKRIPFG